MFVEDERTTKSYNSNVAAGLRFGNLGKKTSQQGQGFRIGEEHVLMKSIKFVLLIIYVIINIIKILLMKYVIFNIIKLL